MLKGKKILLGITGSIAAYKIALLVRSLIKSGAVVKIIMTPAAKDFVSPLTLSTLSTNPVLTDLANNDSWSNHVMLGSWADVMIMPDRSAAIRASFLCFMVKTSVFVLYINDKDKRFDGINYDT